MANFSSDCEMEQEVWVEVNGFKYEVSSFGRVRSKDSIVEDVLPGGFSRSRLIRGKILTPRKEGGGRLVVDLYKDGEPSRYRVSRLVAEAFVDKDDESLDVVLHLDDNLKNNRAINLKWGTQDENLLDMWRKGRGPRGEKNGISVLTEDDVRKIVKLLESGLIQREIADKFGVDRATIGAIKRGVTWTEVTGYERHPSRSARVS
jgi:hypothetical protein